jgi:hypothetical protein
MPEHSSALYARNVQSLLELLVDDEGHLSLNFDDEIIAGACITRDGEIVHAGAKKAIEAAEGKGEAPAPAELAPTPEGAEPAKPASAADSGPRGGGSRADSAPDAGRGAGKPTAGKDER